MSQNIDASKLASSSLGLGLSNDEATVLGSIMSVLQAKKGDKLVKEGEDDATLFVLVEGSLGVNSVIEGKTKLVYTMKVGECAGTRAFVDKSPRKASLIALSDSIVYTLKPADFETLLESSPKIVYKVMCALFKITHSNLMRMNQETEQLSNYISKSGGRY